MTYRPSKIIFLQVDEPEVTWCSEPQEDTDVKYIKHSEYQTLFDALSLCIQVTSSHTASATVGQYGSVCKELEIMNEEIKKLVSKPVYKKLLNYRETSDE